MGLKRKPPPGNVRRVRSNGQNLRYTLTNKVGEIIQCESHQERKLALLLERDPQVIDYRSQPEVLSWYDVQGKAHRYVPDFQVWRRDGTVELHEVTLTQRQKKNEFRQQAAIAICRVRGWTYIVHTEATLPDETEWHNLLALYPYRAESYRVASQVHTIMTRLQHESLTWIDLQSGYTRQERPDLYGSTLYLLWHGHLSTDWKRPLFVNGRLHPQVDLKSEVRHARQAP
jgi:hypothetical protein